MGHNGTPPPGKAHRHLPTSYQLDVPWGAHKSHLLTGAEPKVIIHRSEGGLSFSTTNPNHTSPWLIGKQD